MGKIQEQIKETIGREERKNNIINITNILEENGC